MRHMCGQLLVILGAPSDRGYNSMTQEEAKNFSEIISEHSKEPEYSLKQDVKNALRFSFRRIKQPKESEIQEEAAGVYCETNVL